MPSRSAFPDLAPTRETEWVRWASTRPVLDLDLSTGRVLHVVVVSPHPDDETLACGGLISDLCRAGHEVRVVSVTDGEGSHPDVAELAAVRRAEQAAALTRLGCAAGPIRLGLPDRRVHERIDELEQRLTTAATACDLLVAPWSRDGHSDHDACGFAAGTVAARRGVALLAYPIWAWQWATPTVLDDAAKWATRAVGRDALRAKRAAIRYFASQTTDLYGSVTVDEIAIDRFLRPFEVFADVG